ncbi:MAG: hypothetical protein WDN26_15290 [Chitinophagaceae bacterium]
MDVLNEEFILFLKCALQNHLRYMLIGGYAVNYYGYNRNTDDMDVWLAPTNENKEAFINTLLCMNYSKSEVAALHDEDFTNYFVGNIGSGEARIDVLTIVHRSISYEDAEKAKQVFEIAPGIILNLVPYDILKDIKLRSARPKDLWDVARLEELRNLKNNS